MCHLAKGGTFFMSLSCCFIGHRKIDNQESIKPILKEQVVMLLEKGVTNFYFGSMSDFNDISWEVVTELKEKYPSIKRIYVRSAFQYIDKSYEDYLLESYDDTILPNRVEKAGKASYVERNQEMINASDFCVFYYNPSYLPPKRKNSKRDINEYQPKSGTRLAWEYVNQRKREGYALCCINLCIEGDKICEKK